MNFFPLGNLWADVDTSKEDSEGLAMSETSESHLLMAKGTSKCMLFPALSHSYQATHRVSPDAPDSPKAICLKPHSSFSSVDQQLKQGGLSEKIQ